MSVSVHMGRVKACEHHCDHTDGTKSIRLESENGSIVFINLPAERADAFVMAFRMTRVEP